MNAKDKEAVFAQVGVADSETDKFLYSNRWTQRLLEWGVEARGEYTFSRDTICYIGHIHRCLGILPVPPEQRTDRQFSKIFFIWLSANCNILSYVSELSHISFRCVWLKFKILGGHTWSSCIRTVFAGYMFSHLIFQFIMLDTSGISVSTPVASFSFSFINMVS